MKIATLRCPNCGGLLEAEDGLEFMYCKYCGAQLMIDEMDDGMLNAKVRFREMDHEERMRDKAYEFKQKEWRHELKKKGISIFAKDPSILLLFILVPLIIFGPLVLILSSGCSHSSKVSELNRIESEVIEAIEKKDYDLARVKANQLRLDDSWSSKETEAWDAKREEYVKLIDDKIAERDGKEKPSEQEDKKEDGDWWPFW